MSLRASAPITLAGTGTATVDCAARQAGIQAEVLGVVAHDKVRAVPQAVAHHACLSLCDQRALNGKGVGPHRRHGPKRGKEGDLQLVVRPEIGLGKVAHPDRHQRPAVLIVDRRETFCGEQLARCGAGRQARGALGLAPRGLESRGFGSFPLRPGGIAGEVEQPRERAVERRVVGHQRESAVDRRAGRARVPCGKRHFRVARMIGSASWGRKACASAQRAAASARRPNLIARRADDVISA